MEANNQQTTSFNHTALPYKMEYETKSLYLPTHPQLHNLLCDLVLKYPALTFRAINGHANMVDDVYVFSGTERVANIWMDARYDSRAGSRDQIYVVRSPRIRGGRRGSYDTQRSKHYKIILKTCLNACRPEEDNVLSQKLVEQLENVVDSIHNRSERALADALRPLAPSITMALQGLHTGRISSVPQKLFDILSAQNGAFTAFETLTIAENVRNAFKSKAGLVLKATPDRQFFAYDIGTDEVYSSPNGDSHCLPSEYQVKFAMLKLLEANQPARDIGVKASSPDRGNAEIYYMTPGEVKTTC